MPNREIVARPPPTGYSPGRSLTEDRAIRLTSSFCVSCALGLISLAGGAQGADHPLTAGATATRSTPGRLDRYGDPLPQGAVSRLGTVRLRQDSFITGLAIAADARMMATTGSW